MKSRLCFYFSCFFLENNFAQYYGNIRASLVAQLVKNSPVMQETCDRFLGLEDPLQEGMATHSSILAWRIPMENLHGQRSLAGYSLWAHKE